MNKEEIKNFLEHTSSSWYQNYKYLECLYDLINSNKIKASINVFTARNAILPEYWQTWKDENRQFVHHYCDKDYENKCVNELIYLYQKQITNNIYRFTCGHGCSIGICDLSIIHTIEKSENGRLKEIVLAEVGIMHTDKIFKACNANTKLFCFPYQYHYTHYRVYPNPPNRNEYFVFERGKDYIEEEDFWE